MNEDRQMSEEQQPRAIGTVEKLVYSVDEAAQQLSIGRTFAFKLIADGDLGSIKIGHRRLVARTDLEAFVSKLRSEAA